MFADLDGSFRGFAIALGSPAAQRPSHAARLADPAGLPLPSAVKHLSQAGRLQHDAQHSSGGLHNGESPPGSAADAATSSNVVAPAADSILRPDTAAVRPAATWKQAPAGQPAPDAVAERSHETRHPAASGPPVAVAVAAGQGAAEALALAGALALQVNDSSQDIALLFLFAFCNTTFACTYHP